MRALAGYLARGPSRTVLTDHSPKMGNPAENLHRAELTALERDEHIAKWVELVDLKSVQVAPKSKSDTNPGGAGRREGGINAASRELGIESTDAKRAVKVASLSDEAKAAAREVHLDNNRSALLEAASKPTVAEQAIMCFLGPAEQQNTRWLKALSA